MADSLTSPGLILASNKAIMEAQRGIAFVKNFATDFSAELQGIGKTIKVPVFSGDATVYSETAGSVNDFETTDGAIIPVGVTLDTIVKVTYSLGIWDLTEVNKSSTSRNCGIASALGAKYGIKAILCSAKVDKVSTAAAGDNAAVEKGVGFLVADSAIAIAARGIEQAVDGLYDEYGVTTDEGSGLPVTSFVHGTPGKNARFMNTASLLGVKRTLESSNKAPGYIQLVTA